MESETTSLVKSGWRLGFPDAPTNVKASRNYTNRIHVTWDSPTSQNDYSKLESYSIYRSKLLDENNRPLPRSFTTFEKIASNITETSFMDINKFESLQHDVAYFYIISLIMNQLLCDSRRIPRVKYIFIFQTKLPVCTIIFFTKHSGFHLYCR